MGIDLWQDPTVGWKPAVRAAWKKHSYQEYLAFDGKQLHKDIFGALHEGGASFDPKPFAEDFEERLPFECFCGRRFTTGQGRALHQRHAHAILSPEHVMVSGSQCPCCHMELWSSQRLQQHLSYIHKGLGYNPCFQFLAQIGYRADRVVHHIPKEFSGMSRVDAVQGHGPSLCGVLAPQREYDAAFHELQLIDQHFADLQSNLPAGLLEHAYDALDKATLGWYDRFRGRGFIKDDADELQDLWIATLEALALQEDPELQAYIFLEWGLHELDALVRDLVDGEIEGHIEQTFSDLASMLSLSDLRDRRDLLRGRVHRLQRDLAAPGLVPHREPRADHPGPKGLNHTVDQEVTRNFAIQETWLQQLRKVKWFDIPPQKKLPVYKHLDSKPILLFLHAFSGRRRHEDFHFWLKELGRQRGLTIHVLSLDTAVNQSLGDLSRSSPNWPMILKIMKMGIIAGSLLGPALRNLQ